MKPVFNMLQHLSHVAKSGALELNALELACTVHDHARRLLSAKGASAIGPPDREIEVASSSGEESSQGAELLRGDVDLLVRLRSEDILEDDGAFPVKVVAHLDLVVYAEQVDALLELDFGEALLRAWLWLRNCGSMSWRRCCLSVGELNCECH